MTSTSPILIIGAGVSGLCLAQGLAKNTKLQFRVFERDSGLHVRSQGYRVRLSGEGTLALKHSLSPDQWERLHVNGCAFVRDGSTHRSMDSIIDGLTGGPGSIDGMTSGPGGSGDCAGAHGQGEHPGHEDDKPLACDRGVLREVLSEGLADALQFNKHFLKYHILPNGDIRAEFSDGSTADGCALIGADGCWSRTRHHLLPNYSLKDSEARVIWGKAQLTPDFVAALPEAARTGLGFFTTPHLKVLFEPMRFDRSLAHADQALMPDDYFYFLCFPRTDTLGMTDEQFLHLPNDAAAELAQTLTKDWESHAQTPFQRVAPQAASVSRIPTATPDIPSWTDNDPITLMGDAIHSMAPTAALGATTALRDSYHLLRRLELLQREPNRAALVQALRQYEAEMRVYAAEALKLSAFGGKMVFNFRGFDVVPEIALHD